jgi:Putative transposase
MSSTHISKSSFSAGAMLFLTSSGRYCAISACAAQPRWAHISIDAIAAAMRPSLTTRVRVLSRMFRGKLLAFLKQSYRRGELCFAGKLAELSTPRAFHSLLGSLRRTEWVVYSNPPFGGPEHVLKYLAHYTHRIAISNGRLLSLDNGQVRFRWRDSQHNNRTSIMTLDAVEFIRRFLLHVLTAGFVKIRHFGLLANRNRQQALALCRLDLRATAADPSSMLTEQQKTALSRSCPRCRCGTLHAIVRHPAGQPVSPASPLHCATFNSS